MAGLSLHHLAIGAQNVQKLAAFYRDVFELEHLQTHTYPNDDIRSIWLKCDNFILMIEEMTNPPIDASIDGVSKGLFLIAFQIQPHHQNKYEQKLKKYDIPIDNKSDYTLYARDPEGNRIALSHYPHKETSP